MKQERTIKKPNFKSSIIDKIFRNTYKNKLRALLIGLDCKNVEKMLKEDRSFFCIVGLAIINKIDTNNRKKKNAKP